MFRVTLIPVVVAAVLIVVGRATRRGGVAILGYGLLALAVAVALLTRL